MRLLRRMLAVLAALLACTILGLIPFERNGSVRTEIVIDGPPLMVWRVLTDTADYPAWNPMISRLDGELREGNVIAFTAGTAPDGMTFHPKILVVRKPQELRWKGYVLVPGLFDGEHSFQLEQQGSQTHLIQSEQFTGLLVNKLTAGVLRDTTEQMDAMNAALKQRAESLAKSPPAH